jgi:hypothetical protein
MSSSVLKLLLSLTFLVMFDHSYYLFFKKFIYFIIIYFINKKLNDDL